MAIFRTTSPGAAEIKPDWPHVGSSVQTDFYQTPAGSLIAVPKPNAIDDGVSAAENTEFQRAWAEKHGPYGLVVMVDNLASQDRDARTIYSEIGPDTLQGVALVGGTMLSRAISSFFLGLAKPKVEYRNYASLAAALEWLEREAK